MNIGDKLRRPLELDTTYWGSTDGRLYPCEVVYIHPKGRYYTVEFDFHGTKIRQCFQEGFD